MKQEQPAERRHLLALPHAHGIPPGAPVVPQDPGCQRGCSENCRRVELAPGIHEDTGLQDWVNSLNRDWVISRQRYLCHSHPDLGMQHMRRHSPGQGGELLRGPDQGQAACRACPECGWQLKGCQDVFDTWMDSSISPLYITFWEREPELFKKLFPTSLRPQSHDIIRTWAFYTMLRSHYLTGQRPWNDIMIDGFILGPDGRPMHASDGNAIDPLELLAQYGSDAWRYYSATVSLGRGQRDSPEGRCSRPEILHQALERGEVPVQGDKRPDEHRDRCSQAL